MKLTTAPVVWGIAVITIVLELGEKTLYLGCSHPATVFANVGLMA